MAATGAFKIGGRSIRRGETKDIFLPVSQRYAGDAVRLPIHVIRSGKSGPTVCVTAAIHGDELNGMGIIHELMFGSPLVLSMGTLVLIPAVNIFGFESGERYMPDRRDLNRCFPGSAAGSLASRLANIVFKEVIEKCDHVIDLHTAAVERTNYPNVRADMTDPQVRSLAKAFGCELIVNGKGPDGSMRREATKSGCPAIVLEAGETRKIEPGILEVVAPSHSLCQSV